MMFTDIEPNIYRSSNVLSVNNDSDNSWATVFVRFQENIVWVDEDNELMKEGIRQSGRKILCVSDSQK